MPSLAEVYERRVGEIESIERLYLGFAVLVFGIFLVFFGGAVGVTEPLASLLGASNPTEQWGIGGIIAGLGIPVALLGIFSVIPTSTKNRAIAAAGILLGFLGVLTFVYAYPHRWHGDPTDLTWLVFVVYTTGAVLDFWALFRSILSIELSVPNNSISLEYVGEDGETHEVPIDDSSRSSSTVGLSGIDSETHDAEIVSGTTKTANQTSSNDGTEVVRNGDSGSGSEFRGDRYCGNCAFYDYVREKNGGTAPFCRYHERVLDDLEACDAYEVKIRQDQN